MISDLMNYLKDKKILILGFGREGLSTYKLIRKYFKDKLIYISDENENTFKDYSFLQKDSNITFITGEKYLSNLENYDLIMKSPGISLSNIDVSRFKSKIKSQLELLLEFFDNFTIGITGTKGKSTTSSLIYKILQDQGINSMLLGNIGIPVFDHINEISKDMILVLEMSSHQLEYMDLSPNIAILLNIYEEHLDYYKSFENYIRAKCNIFKYQNKEDFLLFNSDNSILNECVKHSLAKTYKVSLKSEIGDVILKKDKIILKENGKELELYDDALKNRNLIGEYNLNNIMFAVTVSKILKLDLQKVEESINTFKTLEHRLEYVGKYKGISYYDNSIATVPMATIEAVKALGNVDTLIIGGMDRGIDYSKFIQYLDKSNVNNIICMPKTGHDIAKCIKNKKTYITNTLEDAVNLARDVTMVGKSCLLSPAAASYGFFKNFEEKGDKFKELVRNLDTVNG